MAQLQSTNVTGSLTLGYVENTSSAANLWYDSTLNKLRYSYTEVTPGGGSWASGGSLITARAFIAAGGTQNAAFGAGGPPGNQCTEEYNGSSWSTGGALINSKTQTKATGTQNAGLITGGLPSCRCTEEYNGSSWSAGGALITGRQYITMAGEQNSGLVAGGDYSPNYFSCTEEYNGTSWAAGGALIVARSQNSGGGTQNSAITFGGFFSPSFTSLTCTETYDGSSWSTVAAMITPRTSFAGAAADSSCAISFGGNSQNTTPSFTNSTCTEIYNGTSWSTGGALITGASRIGGTGTADSALAMGGNYPAISCTEEFTSTPGSEAICACTL